MGRPKGLRKIDGKWVRTDVEEAYNLTQNKGRSPSGQGQRAVNPSEVTPRRFESSPTRSYICKIPGCRWNTHQVNDDFCPKCKKEFKKREKRSGSLVSKEECVTLPVTKEVTNETISIPSTSPKSRGMQRRQQATSGCRNRSISRDISGNVTQGSCSPRDSQGSCSSHSVVLESVQQTEQNYVEKLIPPKSTSILKGHDLQSSVGHPKPKENTNDQQRLASGMSHVRKKVPKRKSKEEPDVLQETQPTCTQPSSPVPLMWYLQLWDLAILPIFSMQKYVVDKKDKGEPLDKHIQVAQRYKLEMDTSLKLLRHWTKQVYVRDTVVFSTEQEARFLRDRILSEIWSS